MTRSIFYAHSGGVTATINTTAVSFIRHAKSNGIDKIWIGKFGLNGLLNDQLIAAHELSDDALDKISKSPGSAFGSCRIKLPDHNDTDATHRKITQKLLSYGCEGFFYNGGNDSQDTCAKLASYFTTTKQDIQVIGIPKTIDNDLVGTFLCPGFGSAAQYIATSILETALDLRAMSHDSTKVFVLEVMGRDTGWLAASSSLAKLKFPDIPLLTILPESTPTINQIQAKITETVKTHGYCLVCIAEGTPLPKAQEHITDAFGHTRHHGNAALLAQTLQHIGLKTHYAIAGYLQRASYHTACEQDILISKGVGQAAIELFQQNKHGQMVSIGYNHDKGMWLYDSIECTRAANTVRMLPDDFITDDKFGTTTNALAYFQTCLQDSQHQLNLPDYYYDWHKTPNTENPQ